MSENQSVFTFELNESLYFKKGQEVSEMRGISLEPEISIQTYDDYISIRGVIELSGEYEKVQSTEEEIQEENITDFDQFDVKRYVERVTETSDVLSSFSHRFPVEISVPTYRVNDLDEVTVSVDSIDYEIPEESQLKLYSTIAINGINQDVEPRKVKENFTEQSTENLTNHDEFYEDETTIDEQAESPSSEREVEETFEFDVKEGREEENESDELLNLSTPPTLSEPVGEEIEQEEDKEEKEEKTSENRWSFKTKSQSLAEFFENHPSSKTTNDDVDDEDNDADDEDEELYNDEERRSDEEISYLSDIFRDSEDDSYAKMRLCIVQKEDTIETIADRFSISPLQLIKQNHLEDDFDVSEGQLLYIPSKK